MLHAQQKAELGSIITVHEPQLQCLQKFLIVLAGCFLKTCITRWSCQQKCHDCSQPCCITIHLLLELSFLPQGQNKIDCQCMEASSLQSQLLKLHCEPHKPSEVSHQMRRARTFFKGHRVDPITKSVRMVKCKLFLRPTGGQSNQLKCLGRMH